jgi:hypothetical protein
MRLSVQMQFYVREARGRRPVRLATEPQLSEQVGHRRRTKQVRRSERQSSDGADLLLELAGHRGIEREVPRIVRPGRKLVDEQLAVRAEEELHAEHTDILQLLENRTGDLCRPARDLERKRRRRRRDVENVVMMAVLEDRVQRDLTVDAAITEISACRLIRVSTIAS